MFETSASTEKLDAALAKAQGEIKTAIKDKENSHFRAKYADIHASWEACRSALSKHGISVTQWPLDSNDGKLHLITRLACSGEWIKCEMSIPVSKQDAQGFVAATTYAKRAALNAAVGIVAGEEDDDGESAVGRSPAPQASKPQRMVENAPVVNPGPIGGVSPLPPDAYDNGPNFEQYLERNVPKPGALTEKQISRMFAIGKANGWELSDIRNYCMSKWEIASSKDLTRAQYDELTKWMESNPGQVK